MLTLRLTTFGGLLIEVDGTNITQSLPQKTRAMLALYQGDFLANFSKV